MAFEFCFNRMNDFYSRNLGSTVANPNIGSALGVALATSSMPVFGYGYNSSYNISPYGAFNDLSRVSDLTSNTQNYKFNDLSAIDNKGNYFNQFPISGTNYMSYFNNLSNYKPISYGNYNFNSSSSEQQSSSVNNQQKSTEGAVLNRRGDGYGPEFLAKVKQIAQRINCDYRDLLALMNSESGINAHQWCTIPGEENKAVGLIQFREGTARTLGTSMQALANMTPLEQLDYVEKYFKYWIDLKNLNGKQLSAGDLYTLTYTPAYAGQSVLSSQGQSFYDRNKGLDVNGDKKITTDDLAQRIQKKRVSDNSFLA